MKEKQGEDDRKGDAVVRAIENDSGAAGVRVGDAEDRVEWRSTGQGRPTKNGREESGVGEEKEDFIETHQVSIFTVIEKKSYSSTLNECIYECIVMDDNK